MEVQSYRCHLNYVTFPMICIVEMLICYILNVLKCRDSTCPWFTETYNANILFWRLGCSMNSNVCLLVGRSLQHFAPDWNISTTGGGIDMKIRTDIHVSLSINCANFGDPLTFHSAPSSDQNFNLSKLWFMTNHMPQLYFCEELISKC